MDEIPSAMLAASVRLEHGNDQSVVVVARVPARSPQPAHPPESALSALLVGAAAVTPPEAKDPQWEDVVLPS